MGARPMFLARWCRAKAVSVVEISYLENAVRSMALDSSQLIIGEANELLNTPT